MFFVENIDDTLKIKKLFKTFLKRLQQCEIKSQKNYDYISYNKNTTS